MALIRPIPTSGIKRSALWSNGSPTTSIDSATTITLSESMDNFDYLEFTYRPSTSTATPEVSIMVSVDEFKNMSGSNPFLFLVSPRVSPANYCTCAQYASVTSVTFTVGVPIASTSGGNGGQVIPVRINGIKF